MMLTGSTEFSMFCLGDAYFESEEMQGYTAEEIAAAKAFASKYGSDMYRILMHSAVQKRWQQIILPISIM